MQAHPTGHRADGEILTWHWAMACGLEVAMLVRYAWPFFLILWSRARGARVGVMNDAVGPRTWRGVTALL